MEPFASALVKIARAEKHIESLKSEITAFLAEENYEVRQNFDTETGRKTAIFHVLREVPIGWAVIFGEILHNLRSALDHIITDLTVSESGHPLEQTEFPIFEDEVAFFALRTKGSHSGQPTPNSGSFRIRGVSPAARAVIQSLQPFEFAKVGKISSLLILRNLNIIDKHRTLNIVRQQASEFRCDILRDIYPVEMNLPVGEFKDGTKLVEWLPAMEPKEEMDMKFEFNFFIALCEQGGNYNLFDIGDVLLSAVKAVVRHLKTSAINKN